MRPLLIHLFKFMLIGAIIGAILGAALAEGLPEGLPAGAFIGAMGGLSIVALRWDNYRLQSRRYMKAKSSGHEAAGRFINESADSNR
ncbi:MAG: hypothetical protein OXG78_07385 [Chloroflexi bacterium]|nr:hypothetical protein [Chloroflexota bacterium]